MIIHTGMADSVNPEPLAKERAEEIVLAQLKFSYNRKLDNFPISGGGGREVVCVFFIINSLFWFLNILQKRAERIHFLNFNASAAG